MIVWLILSFIFEVHVIQEESGWEEQSLVFWRGIRRETDMEIVSLTKARLQTASWFLEDSSENFTSSILDFEGIFLARLARTTHAQITKLATTTFNDVFQIACLIFDFGSEIAQFPWLSNLTYILLSAILYDCYWQFWTIKAETSALIRTWEF